MIPSTLLVAAIALGVVGLVAAVFAEHRRRVALAAAAAARSFATAHLLSDRLTAAIARRRDAQSVASCVADTPRSGTTVAVVNVSWRAPVIGLVTAVVEARGSDVCFLGIFGAEDWVYRADEDDERLTDEVRHWVGVIRAELARFEMKAAA
jgi:hypothetical protein